MSGVDLDERDWGTLHKELELIRMDTVKISSFMAQHANKKWKVNQDLF